MDGLQLKVGDETRVFLPSGDVGVLSNGQVTPNGKWRTNSLADEPKDNQIRYTLDSVDQTAVPVHYSFDDNNQLNAVIPAAANGGSDSSPFAFLGTINIDGTYDLVYSLMDDEGNSINNSITLYGSISVDPTTHNLALDLGDAGKTQITGASGLQSLNAARNNLAEFDGDDLLQFSAVTTNLLKDGSAAQTIANINLPGSWDIKGGNLVFVSKLEGGNIEIGFAGTYKGITVGLAYFGGPDGNEFAFNVNGQHTWDNGSSANWNLSLGYSGKTFTATLSGQSVIKTGDGTFTISGKTSLVSADGKPTFDLNLDVVYQWQKGFLHFKADIASQGDNLSYDLGLEGNFVFMGGTLTFQIKFSNQPAGPSLQVNLNFTGGKESLIQSLSLVLNVSPDQVDLTFSFQVKLSWEDGKLKKSAAEPIAA
ncbi:MAG: hypothetical protein V7641_318 [Blastocatellia bacterium]